MTKAFTLIETLIALSIAGALVLLIATFGRDIFWQNYVTSRTLVAEGEAKLALNKLVTELRSAEPASTGAYPLELASSSALIFYSDPEGSGTRLRLRYFLDGKNFKRGVTKPSGEPYTHNLNQEKINTIVTDVINPEAKIFTYYDRSYDGTASSSPLNQPVDIKSVRLVKIEFLVDANRERAPVPLYLSSQVMMRNLKDNL